ncbi:MAG: NifB/NifX family molybdenum-iron cluster-binding protein [Candidatus Altiarchaeota archaeon]
MIRLKVAVASDDRTSISHHFGRALGFKVFEILEDKVISEEYRENRGKSSGECGSCDHSTMINNIRDCDAVISFGMGRRIYEDLMRNNILAIVTEEKTVDEAVRKFLSQSLTNRIDKLH